MTPGNVTRGTRTPGMKAGRPFSIRTRLLLSVGSILLVASVSGALLVVRVVREQSYASFDARLGEHAQEVMAALQLPDEPGERIEMRQTAVSVQGRDWYWLNVNGERLGERDVPSLPPSEAASLADAAPTRPDGRGFITFAANGARYRALVMRQRVLADPDSKEGPPFFDATLVYGAPVDRVEGHIQDVAHSAALGCLLMLFASLGATWLAVYFGLRPLRRLAERATAIDSRSWEFQRAADGLEVQELAPLTEALTLLVDRLREAFDRERQFFGDAAHELKTGVAITKSTLQLGLQRKREAVEYQGYLSRALDDTERLHDLVARMLTLAAIDAGAGGGGEGRAGWTGPERDEAAAAERADVEVELETVIEGMASFAEQRGCAMELAVAKGMTVTIRADDFRLVFQNLIENAVRYSETGGRVEVRARREGGMCALEVRDWGAGIAAEALPHIFERFWRGDQSRSRASGGFGLGLAIASGLVRRAGGEISATSALGQGTTLMVRLPLERE